MKLTETAWSKFKLSELFTFKKGSRLTKEDMIPGNIHYLGAISENNGIRDLIGNDEHILPGNAITVNYNGSVGEAFYQDEEFWASDDVNCLYAKGWTLNKYNALFICTIIKQEKYRFSYGRKWKLEKMSESTIQLPCDSFGRPDFRLMEDFVKSLRHKPITTNNVERVDVPDSSKYKHFLLNELFDIDMGSKLDFQEMTFSAPMINFVGRSADNNGIMGVVDALPGERAYPKGVLTIALGGSLGSTFYQCEPFYTSQNVAVLIPKESIDYRALLFLSTLIKWECKSRFVAFGRELNTHIRTDFGISLPVRDDGKPDWNYMSDYISRLRFGDKIIS